MARMHSCVWCGHCIENCKAQPGMMTCISVGEQFMSNVLVRIVMPLVLGLSWSCVSMNDIFGLCFCLRHLLVCCWSGTQ